jgi:hypothetical protein
MPKAADRCFQVAFRIDQEVGGNDDLFAGLDAIHHFDMVLATPTQLHVPRLEAPFAVRDEDDLAGAAVDHRRIRHGHDLSLASTGTSTCANIAGFRSWPGLASSTRTGTVRVSGLRVG